MRIGVFGGTFDPVHWGHLVLADEARAAAGLDRILFVPAGVPPHKNNRALTDYSHRLAMVRLAVAGSPEFEVSDIESSGSGPHYSFDTLSLLSDQRPGDELHFLMGSDSLLELPGWRDPDDLVRRFPLVVLPRPGFDVSRASSIYLSRAVIVNGIMVGISSTLVRKRLVERMSVRYLIPEPVLDYVQRNGLYR